MDDDKSRLNNYLRVLVDEKASAEAIIDVAGARTLGQAQGLLEDYFDAPGAPDAVRLTNGSTYVGVATRATLEQSNRTAADPGPSGEIGIGERIQLTGISTRYRLLKFACLKCSTAPIYRIHYDERDLPTCDRDGLMELQHED